MLLHQSPNVHRELLNRKRHLYRGEDESVKPKKTSALAEEETSKPKRTSEERENPKRTSLSPEEGGAKNKKSILPTEEAVRPKRTALPAEEGEVKPKKSSLSLEGGGVSPRKSCLPVEEVKEIAIESESVSQDSKVFNPVFSKCFDLNISMIFIMLIFHLSDRFCTWNSHASICQSSEIRQYKHFQLKFACSTIIIFSRWEASLTPFQS